MKTNSLAEKILQELEDLKQNAEIFRQNADLFFKAKDEIADLPKSIAKNSRSIDELRRQSKDSMSDLSKSIAKNSISIDGLRKQSKDSMSDLAHKIFTDLAYAKNARNQVDGILQSVHRIQNMNKKFESELLGANQKLHQLGKVTTGLEAKCQKLETRFEVLEKRSYLFSIVAFFFILMLIIINIF